MARDGIHFVLTKNNIIFFKPDDLESRHWQWVGMNPTGLMGLGPQLGSLGYGCYKNWSCYGQFVRKL